MTISDRRPGGRSHFYGDIVLKVESYGCGAAAADCYPGLIKGRVMGGVLNNRTVEVAIRKSPANHRVPRVADLQNEAGLAHAADGGYLALADARSDNGRMTAQWVNRMGGPEAEIRSGMPVRIAPAYDGEGNARRYKANGAAVYAAQILHLTEYSAPVSKLALTDALRAALEIAGRRHGRAGSGPRRHTRAADADGGLRRMGSGARRGRGNRCYVSRQAR